MRLIGDDADLYGATLSREISGDGLSELNDLQNVEDGGVGEFLITGTGANSAFAPLGIGDVFESKNGTTVLRTGDRCRQLVDMKRVAAVTSWSIELTADEVEVTTLADNVKKYRKGKVDATGSMKGQFDTHAVKKGEGIQNQFFNVIIRKSDGMVQMVPKKEGSIFIKGYLQSKDTPEADKIFTSAEIQPGTITLGADLGSAQEFDGPFRLTGDTNLQLYYQERV